MDDDWVFLLCVGIPVLLVLLILLAPLACHFLRSFCDDDTEPMRRETQNEAAEFRMPTERSSLLRNPNLDPPPAYNTLFDSAVGNETQRPPPYSKSMVGITTDLTKKLGQELTQFVKALPRIVTDNKIEDEMNRARAKTLGFFAEMKMTKGGDKKKKKKKTEGGDKKTKICTND